MPATAPSVNKLLLPVIAMALVILVSNLLVVHPLKGQIRDVVLGNWFTYATFTFPFAFLVTDLTNRLLGARSAYRLAFIGFAVGIGATFALGLLRGDAGLMRIAGASGTAFLAGQLLDVTLFDRIRRWVWWAAPLVSSFFASALDTALFYTLAFYGDTSWPWQQVAVGDFSVKIAMALILLLPYRVLVKQFSAGMAQPQA